MKESEVWDCWAASGLLNGENLLPDPAPVEVLDKVYGSLLNRTTLSDEDGWWLGEQGLCPGEARARGYRTMPTPSERNKIASQLWLIYKDALYGVPGFACDEGAPIMCGLSDKARGILFPTRDHFGHIVALRWRNSDAVDRDDRYKALTSRFAGGPKGVT